MIGEDRGRQSGLFLFDHERAIAVRAALDAAGSLTMVGPSDMS
jgi:hypothetical protein